MNYRPQNVYKSPKGCEDQSCPYSFDLTNTPVLAGTLQPLQTAYRIPLELDKDADYYLRGISSTDPAGALEIRLEDPKGNPLSDSENPRQQTNLQPPEVYSFTQGLGIVALDSDDYGVYCPAGSRLLLYVYNNSGANPAVMTGIVVNLWGIKRYSGERCAA